MLAVARQADKLVFDLFPAHEQLVPDPRKAVGRRHQQAVDADIAQVSKENFDLLEIGSLINGGVGADPEPLGLGGLDGLDGQVEHPRAP